MDWIDLARDRDRWRALVITVWMLALLERPHAVQVLKNFPTVYGTRRFITAFTRASTCPCPEPEQSSPYHLIQSLQDPYIHIPYLRSFTQRIRPSPRLAWKTPNVLVSYGEGLLAPCPSPKLEDHPLTVVRDCLFSAFHPQPEDVPCGNVRVLEWVHNWWLLKKLV
jgi:hypothetical protein